MDYANTGARLLALMVGRIDYLFYLRFGAFVKRWEQQWRRSTDEFGNTSPVNIILFALDDRGSTTCPLGSVVEISQKTLRLELDIQMHRTNNISITMCVCVCVCVVACGCGSYTFYCDKCQEHKAVIKKVKLYKNRTLDYGQF